MQLERLTYGRETCGTLQSAEEREWLVTNGIGGYAAGTIAGSLTRRYHGLLVAALNPPLGRTVLVSKLDESVNYNQQNYALSTNRWGGNKISPLGYLNIESFQLVGTTPNWRFACADALLEKQVWMAYGQNTTYITYRYDRGSGEIVLTLKALVSYRDYHGSTTGGNWHMQVEPHSQGVKVVAFPQAVPFYLLADRSKCTIESTWYYNFELSVENYRGLSDREDIFHAATFTVTLQPGESLTIVASTEARPSLDSATAWQTQRDREQDLLNIWHQANSLKIDTYKAPAWIQHLILAADGFIVERTSEDFPDGKTVIAGYHWFSDWGRDTMISLPGLTLATGRLSIARSILLTFAKHISQGMLPNRFPDAGEIPEYNTVDATLWYFEAIRAYYEASQDLSLLEILYPSLVEIIDWHCRGTRYQIHLDHDDGLIYAGETGVQLTWMDAKVGDWVVTPRIGKPIEINALWYNAVSVMAAIAKLLNQPSQLYSDLAASARQGFQRFWNPATGYCYDVLDTPTGNDASLRPNQIFAVSLSEIPLLTPDQQKAVVDTCGRSLLTSYGLRSLAPTDSNYQGRYGGSPLQRDGAYHQGTVWGWLLGSYVRAHLRVYQNPQLAYSLLQPMADHLSNAGVGWLSEIFDGDAPFYPRGCVAQAWTVAETLQAWLAITQLESKS